MSNTIYSEMVDIMSMLEYDATFAEMEKSLCSRDELNNELVERLMKDTGLVRPKVEELINSYKSSLSEVRERIKSYFAIVNDIKEQKGELLLKREQYGIDFPEWGTVCCYIGINPGVINSDASLPFKKKISIEIEVLSCGDPPVVEGHVKEYPNVTYQIETDPNLEIRISDVRLANINWERERFFFGEEEVVRCLMSEGLSKSFIDKILSEL